MENLLRAQPPGRPRPSRSTAAPRSDAPAVDGERAWADDERPSGTSPRPGIDPGPGQGHEYE
jgi:hypothetical protein